MSAALNDIATEDRYAEATTLSCPRTARVNLEVSNAAVLWQRGKGSPPAWDEPEERLLPGDFSLDRACDAVRLRSAVAGKPARVNVAAATREELGGG